MTELTDTHLTFASAVDTDRYGEYRVPTTPPIYRFSRPITTADVAAEPGRFHIYAGWFCPWAQRVTLVLAHGGLSPEQISVSYVDNSRDGRGWAFREANGADPVSDFTLLRDAYEATTPGFDGHISVPTVWDRATRKVWTNDIATVDSDIAQAFGVDDLYPAELRTEIDELGSWITPEINQGKDFQRGIESVEKRLENSDFLVGNQLTLADTRLWVTLIRAAGEQEAAIAALPQLSAYRDRLAQLPDFVSTTRYDSFGKENPYV